MTLPLFVPSKHHIGLGTPGSEAGLMLNSYVKRSQESPFGKVHQGGPNDQLGTSRSSSWTQDNFAGGQYQPEFSDVAMFAMSRNVMPTQQSRSVRATGGLMLARPVAAMGGSVATDIPNGSRPLATMHAGGQAIFGFYNRMVRCLVDGAGSVSTTIDAFNTTTRRCYYMEPITGTIYVGGQNGKIYTFDAVTLALTATINPIDVATGLPPDGIPLMIHVWGDLLFVAWSSFLYVQDSTGKFQRVGLAKGSKSPTAGRLPGLPVAAQAYNGQLYILVSRSTGLEGVICATTGTQLSTVAEIPFAATPTCMTQYAGRLYIGAVGYDLDGNDGHAELYELTGNALRLVRSWYRDRLMAGSYIAGIYSMDVFDGLLCFVNHSKKAVEFYDASQDAFFTGPAIDLDDATASVYATSAVPMALVSQRDQILVWFNEASSSSRGIYKIRQPAETGTLPSHRGMGAFIETSDFGPEPGRKKRWGDVAVRTRGDWCRGMDFCVDGGATWTPVPLQPGDRETSGVLSTAIFRLGSLAPPGRRIRLRFSLWNSAMLSQAIEMNAFTLHFSFIESGFHGFQLTLPATHNIECPDGTIYTGTAKDIRDAIWTWADLGAVINLIDRDGVLRPVTVTQPVESEPQLNDRTNREAFVNCYLLEL